MLRVWLVLFTFLSATFFKTFFFPLYFVISCHFMLLLHLALFLLLHIFSVWFFSSHPINLSQSFKLSGLIHFFDYLRIKTLSEYFIAWHPLLDFPSLLLINQGRSCNVFVWSSTIFHWKSSSLPNNASDYHCLFYLFVPNIPYSSLLFFPRTLALNTLRTFLLMWIIIWDLKMRCKYH